MKRASDNDYNALELLGALFLGSCEGTETLPEELHNLIRAARDCRTDVMKDDQYALWERCGRPMFTFTLEEPES